MQAEELIIVPGKDEAGQPIFSVLIKRTYDIRSGQAATRSESVQPLLRGDVYYDDGDPQTATVKYENDLAPFKLATDVVVIAKAHAPNAHPVSQIDVALFVDGHKKVIRVYGDRQCVYRRMLSPGFTEPKPFTEMEIRYERAYGGKDLLSKPELPFYYPRNTMGKGLALKNTREVIEGLSLPNLEDPEDLLTPDRVVLGEPENWAQQPLPQGLGWYQRTWYPRCSFVGSVPGFVQPGQVLREEQLGFAPKDQIALARQFRLPSFDVRFNNGASLGLALPYLAGGESVRLYNLAPEARLEFTLPKDKPRLMLDIGLGENELKPVLHTVCIRAEDKQVDLLWRGAHPYPGADWLPEMKKLVAQAL